MKINKKGFTLIEMLVTVLIIATLMFYCLPQYFKSVEKMRASEVLSLFNSISEAQERHYLTYGSYAEMFNELDFTYLDKNGLEVGNRNELETLNFVLTLNGTSGNQAGIIATRKGGKYQYKIARSYNTSSIGCDNEEICSSFLPNYNSNISEVVEEN